MLCNKLSTYNNVPIVKLNKKAFYLKFKKKKKTKAMVIQDYLETSTVNLELKLKSVKISREQVQERLNAVGT